MLILLVNSCQAVPAARKGSMLVLYVIVQQSGLHWNAVIVRGRKEYLLMSGIYYNTLLGTYELLAGWC